MLLKAMNSDSVVELHLSFHFWERECKTLTAKSGIQLDDVMECQGRGFL